MKLKCNTIGLISIFLGVFLCHGCFPEGTDGCPEDMHLSFFLEDEYEPGDYDSRVGNDIQLYIFQSGKLTKSMVIPYEDIRSSQPYAIRKDNDIQGDLFLVAWAVEKLSGNQGLTPDWSLSEPLDGKYISLGSQVHEEAREPVAVELYLGTLSTVEAVDETTRHRMNVGPASCRIEVYITDLSRILEASERSFVEIHGTSSEMDMYKNGKGPEAIVYKELQTEDGGTTRYSTGRFGVLPSAQGQTIGVDIYADNVLLQTLHVPRESLPRGAEAGGLIIFEYTLGEAHYLLTVDDYTEKIVIVDEM